MKPRSAVAGILLVLMQHRHQQAYCCNGLLSAAATTTTTYKQLQQHRQHGGSGGGVFPASISLGSSSRRSKTAKQQIITSMRGGGRTRATVMDAAGAGGSSGKTNNNNDEDRILLASTVTGVITAAMGFLYGKLLSVSVKSVWTTLPAYLFARGSGTSSTGTLRVLLCTTPAYFITAMCTLGGLLMGLVTTYSDQCGSSFNVSDFVGALSSVPEHQHALPPSRLHVVPLLFLSLITSTFGFSVGPEAPMVCAGGLIGASLARNWFYKQEHRTNRNSSTSKRQQETLAYAGAAGALTAFMGIPIAGSIFALELTRSNEGLNRAGETALAPSIVASLAALVILRGVLAPSLQIGGHFTYGSGAALGSAAARAAAAAPINGLTMITTSIICGIGGAMIGTIFHKFVALLKQVAWYYPTTSTTATTSGKTTTTKNKSWFQRRRPLVVKTLIGVLVGILSSKFPQTLFWGEGSLQCMVDGQQTAFAATKHGLATILTQQAYVNPSVPFQSAHAALSVGVAKLVAIALACAGKFPGGIIFPLFFAAAPLAHAAALFLPHVVPLNVIPVAVMSLMASTQSSVTKTPLATALILSLTASSKTELSVLLPACLVSSYLGVSISRRLSRNSYFQYSDE